jgi:hypothetical protein
MILACFFPAKPGKDGLPFPSQAVLLTPSRQYDTSEASTCTASFVTSKTLS